LTSLTYGSIINLSNRDIINNQGGTLKFKTPSTFFKIDINLKF